MRYLIGVAVILLALAGAFVGGRYTAPVKVETRDVEHVVYKDKIIEKVVTVTVQAKAETKIVYRDRVVTKDGTVHEREVERTATHEDTNTKTDDHRAETSTGAATVERVTITTLRPDWRVAVLAGAQIREPLLPLTGPLVLGFEVDRRLIGGLSVGVWANTGGAVGGSVSLEF